MTSNSQRPSSGGNFGARPMERVMRMVESGGTEKKGGISPGQGRRPVAPPPQQRPTPPPGSGGVSQKPK